MIAEAIYWISIGFIGYAYMGYPLCLKVLSMLRSRAVQRAGVRPHVSFVIAAYNEEKRIREKIENTLVQDYSKELIEIIVASDCSTDETDDIVRGYAAKGVKLVRAADRKGKENAQKIAVDASRGEIIVFSDVATVLERRGVSNIVRNFNDPTVGCVSSVDKFVDADGKISGEGAYVRYEMALRGLESRVNTLVGLSGSFFAARRKVCTNWAVDLQSDFNTLLSSIRMGLRGVSDPESVGYYKNITDEKKEFERKVRTVLRGISVFMKSLELMNPLRYGLFSWQFFSHKLCRWLVPFALTAAFVSNGFLVERSPVYICSFLAQLGFYAVALWGAARVNRMTRSIVKVPVYFVLVNLSIASAWFRYFTGQRSVVWEPSKR